MASRHQNRPLPLMKRKTVVIADDIDAAVLEQARKNEREFSAEVRALLKEALAARGVKLGT